MKEHFNLTPQNAALLHRYGLDAGRLRGCSVREYSFGERIVTVGLPLAHLFVVTAGKAKVGITAPNGRNLIMCFYVSDGLIGEAEFFAGADTGNTTVVALGDFHCIAVPVAQNSDCLNRSLEFARSAAAELSKKLANSDTVAAAALYPAEVRLCRYILGAADGGAFRDIMTDVACSVGISYRHLYRTLGHLCADGILKKSPSGYHIENFEALRSRALAEN